MNQESESKHSAHFHDQKQQPTKNSQAKMRNTIPDHPSSLSRLLPSAAAPSTRPDHTKFLLLGCGQAHRRTGTAGQTRSRMPLSLQQHASSTQHINSSLAA